MAQDKDKVQISVKNVPPQLYEQAKEKAEREDRPLTQVIRELLREWVKGDKPKPNK